MKQLNSLSPRIGFEIAFLVLTFLFFLSLGSDFPGHYQLRIWFAGALLMSFLFYFRKFYTPLRLLACSPLLVFFLFLIFLVVRASVAVFLLKGGQGQAEISDVLLERQIVAPLRWFVLFGTFVLSYVIFSKRTSLQRLQFLFMVSGLFLAANCLPALMLYGDTIYRPDDGPAGFFFPFLYFQPFVAEYFLARVGHANYLGDVMAFGFFSILGVLFYSLQTLFDELKKKENVMDSLSKYDWPKMLLSLTFGAVIALAIVLLFSRGTIGAFLIACVIFFSLVLIRFRSRVSWVFSTGILIISIVFVASVIDVDALRKEMGTLQSEIEHADADVRYALSKGKSIYSNREGAKRAVRIFLDYPLWGVGTDGYREVSKNYETIEGAGRQLLTNYEAMSHYFHLLAEEGSGAFLYYLFLLTYGGFFLWKLFRVRSRFQFLMAIALFTPVCMVFGHAVMNQLMQRFAMSMIVYISMGASLSVLREDFQHES